MPHPNEAHFPVYYIAQRGLRNRRRAGGGRVLRVRGDIAVCFFIVLHSKKVIQRHKKRIDFGCLLSTKVNLPILTGLTR